LRWNIFCRGLIKKGKGNEVAMLTGLKPYFVFNCIRAVWLQRESDPDLYKKMILFLRKMPKELVAAHARELKKTPGIYCQWRPRIAAQLGWTLPEEEKH
jgi:hypothetical protein